MARNHLVELWEQSPDGVGGVERMMSEDIETGCIHNSHYEVYEKQSSWKRCLFQGFF